ncbi:MAG: hypothetical protein PHW01_03775 [Patescibacteria group bacterium]|nr:hypothetical protein [Patescibacteria group bacterium]
MPASPPNNLPLPEDNNTPPFQTPPFQANNNGANPLAEVRGENSSPIFSEPREGLGEVFSPGEGGSPGVAGRKDFFASSEQASRVMPSEYRGTGGERNPSELSPVTSTMSPVAVAPQKRQIFSKKLAIILIILVLGGGGAFVYFNWFWNPSAEPDTPPVITPALPENLETSEGGETVPSEQSDLPVTPPPSPNQDSDNDGLTDQEEEALGTNLKEADSDQDGLPDGWEKQNNLNPLDPGDAHQDPDGDGLDNSQEYYYTTNPFLSDTDGDSYNDGAEVEKGYDPARAGEKLEPAPEEQQQGAATTPAERDKIRKNDLEALEVALELYYDDNGFFPDNLTDLSPDYVIKVPEDPLTSRYSYQYQKLSPRSYEFTVAIEGDNDPEDLADGAGDHLYKVKVGE